jgi:hypothetical protein
MSWYLCESKQQLGQEDVQPKLPHVKRQAEIGEVQCKPKRFDWKEFRKSILYHVTQRLLTLLITVISRGQILFRF